LIHVSHSNEYKVMARFYLLLAFGALLALWAQWRLQAVYGKWSRRSCAARPLTGAQAAREILDAAGLSHVAIQRTGGYLTDHYDPVSRTLRLSEEVHNTDSLAAVGIAAHEAGHAMQHDERSWPMRARLSMLPLSRFAAMISLPLLLAGLVFRMPPLIWFGLGAFVLLLIFQFVTLPLEFDASRRATRWLRERGIVAPSELDGVGEVLNAAAWTYLAAFTMSFVHLLRLLRFGRLLRPPL
jgi:uncharacterized protein